MSSTSYWYLTRATGVVSLVLLTLVVALGVLNVSRAASVYWPRFLTDGLHRRLSLLAVAFLFIHVLTSVLDTYAPIGILDVVIPFHSAYRPLWLGLGAASLDLLAAVLITSLLRDRVGMRVWRAIHWLAYASFPLALLHALGTGSDVKRGWMLLIAVSSLLVVLAAVLARLATAAGTTLGAKVTGAGLAFTFAASIAIWLPIGPLAGGWAKRAGTPVTLIHGSTKTGPVRGG